MSSDETPPPHARQDGGQVAPFANSGNHRVTAMTDFRRAAAELPRTPITHVRYVAQAVPDLSASAAFYGGIWGLREPWSFTGVRSWRRASNEKCS